MGLLGVDDCPAGATTPVHKNVTGSSSKAQTAEYCKSKDSSLSLKRLFSVHVRSILDMKKKKLDNLYSSANQLCGKKKMAVEHILD